MITFTLDVENTCDLEIALECVINQIRKGYTSGIEPSWDISGEDEEVEVK